MNAKKNEVIDSKSYATALEQIKNDIQQSQLSCIIDYKRADNALLAHRKDDFR